MLDYDQWFADRFIDDIVANDIELSPVYGYQSQLLVSLETALQPIQPLIDNLADYIKVAEERCHYPNEHGLTKDQSASVYLYTMEWGNDSFYRVLNAALRTQDRSTLKPWFAFLKLFDTALRKLPHRKQNVWRGVRSGLGKECKKGDELIWWSVNSCSLDVHVIEHFLTADSTLFLIEAMNARDVTGYTNYPSEHEVILPPGICLHVVANSMAHAGGLHVVHLREVEFSGHSKHLVAGELGKKSVNEHDITLTNSLQSKIVEGFRRACLRKSCKIFTVVLILIGIVSGTIVGVVVSRNKSPANKSQPPDNFTSTRSSTTPFTSLNTTQGVTSTGIANSTRCSDDYPPIGFVYCLQWTEVLSCGSTDCDAVSAVYGCQRYSSDCYVIGQVVTDGDSNNKWHRINLRVGGHGYVNSLYCYGYGGLCR